MADHLLDRRLREDRDVDGGRGVRLAEHTVQAEAGQERVEARLGLDLLERDEVRVEGGDRVRDLGRALVELGGCRDGLVVVGATRAAIADGVEEAAHVERGDPEPCAVECIDGHGLGRRPACGGSEHEGHPRAHPRASLSDFAGNR